MEYRDKTYDLSDKCLEAINYLHSPAYRFDLHRDIAGAEYALVNSATDREKMFISVKTAASAYFRRLKETICRNSSDSTGNPMPAIMKLGKRHLWAGCCRQIISAGWTTFRICLRNPLLNLWRTYFPFFVCLAFDVIMLLQLDIEGRIPYPWGGPVRCDITLRIQCAFGSYSQHNKAERGKTIDG